MSPRIPKDPPGASHRVRLFSRGALSRRSLGKTDGYVEQERPFPTKIRPPRWRVGRKMSESCKQHWASLQSWFVKGEPYIAPLMEWIIGMVRDFPPDGYTKTTNPIIPNYIRGLHMRPEELSEVVSRYSAAVGQHSTLFDLGLSISAMLAAYWATNADNEICVEEGEVPSMRDRFIAALRAVKVMELGDHQGAEWNHVAVAAGLGLRSNDKAKKSSLEISKHKHVLAVTLHALVQAIVHLDCAQRDPGGPLHLRSLQRAAHHVAVAREMLPSDSERLVDLAIRVLFEASDDQVDEMIYSYALSRMGIAMRMGRTSQELADAFVEIAKRSYDEKIEPIDESVARRAGVTLPFARLSRRMYRQMRFGCPRIDVHAMLVYLSAYIDEISEGQGSNVPQNALIAMLWNERVISAAGMIERSPELSSADIEDDERIAVGALYKLTEAYIYYEQARSADDRSERDEAVGRIQAILSDESVAGLTFASESYRLHFPRLVALAVGRIREGVAGLVRDIPISDDDPDDPDGGSTSPAGVPPGNASMPSGTPQVMLSAAPSTYYSSMGQVVPGAMNLVNVHG